MATARMIVIAVDGVTRDRLTSWVAAGELPTFARLLTDGAHAALGGTLLADPDAAELPTVCAIAAAGGRRVSLVAGAVADVGSGHDCQSFLDEQVARQLARLAEAIDLLDRRSADLIWVGCPGLGAMPRCCANVTSTSHPAHVGASALGDTMLRIHQVIDEGLAEIVRRLDDDTALLVVSNQASRMIESTLETWLEEAGFLTRKSQVAMTDRLVGIGAEVYAFVRALRRSGLDWLPKLVPQRLMATTPVSGTNAPRATSAANATHVEWSATRVYCSSGFGLRVNLRGREVHGVVAPEDFGRVCDEVSTALGACPDPTTGRRMGGAVRRRHDVADAALADAGPDLIVATPAAGLVLLAGRAARPGAVVPVVSADDAAATLLHLIGLPKPSGMVGDVASRLLADGHDAVPRAVAVNDQHRRAVVDDVREEVGYP